MARRHGDFSNMLLQYPYLVFLTLFSCQTVRSICSFSSSCQINIESIAFWYLVALNKWDVNFSVQNHSSGVPHSVSVKASGNLWTPTSMSPEFCDIPLSAAEELCGLRRCGMLMLMLLLLKWCPKWVMKVREQSCIRDTGVGGFARWELFNRPATLKKGSDAVKGA